jgi:hypothetical protein
MLPKIRKKISNKEKEELLDRIKRWLSEGADDCKDEHDRCEENNLYIAGSQWREGDVARQAARDRPSFDMNKVLPALNAIANREIMNRFVSKVYARSKEDGGWADVANEFIRWQQDLSSTEHEESMSFRNMVASGYSVMHKYWDSLAEDGEGQIVDEDLPIWWMLWDGRARKQNLEDRRWHICGKFVPKEEAEEAYGELSPSSRKFFKNLFRDDAEFDPKAIHGGARWPWEAVAAGRWYNRADAEVFVIETEYLAIKEQYKAAIPVFLQDYADLIANPESQIAILQDPESGEIQQVLTMAQLEELGEQVAQMPLQPLTGQDFAAMDEETQAQIRQMMLMETQMEVFETRKELNAFGDQYFDIVGEDFEDFYKDSKRIVKYVVMVADEILEAGERPMGFTYQFMTGWPKITRDKTTFFGFVDVAKGPQDWRNTFMSLVLTRLAQSPKQTLLIEEGAVEDIDHFYDQLANPRGAAQVPAGFVSGNRFLQLDPPHFPPMEGQLVQMADSGVSEMGGLSGVDLGQQADLRRVSNTTVQSVRESSNTILAVFFDSLRRYRKTNAKATLRFMKEFYQPEQVIRIVGQEKAPFVSTPDKWPEFERFDIKIDESPTSVSERMEFFDFLTRTGTLDKWVSSGFLPPGKVFEWVPWMPESDRQEILQYQQQKEAEKNVLQQLLQQLQEIQDPQVQEIVQQAQQQMEEGG